ncbi:DUF3833 family protein [Pseudomonas stutzeri]|uniref:Lipoprotein n=1 Tax=Stutzerimonas stutzeri KOS6 TaxID=1218352 RepID=A0A061JN98_STUST|nr:DUF3833 domain-containing protein [Stutzerimonas stutzeri]EWC40093.1 hypothetical protein B597_016830 [Stutzerimonas stutzeri KOS6]MBK3867491.1 DUF3833 family protein [Stutzerimonas stutzeri]
MKKIMILAFCLLLLSCTAVDVERYRNETPQLDMRDYFVGRLDAWGMFQKRSGEVVKRFHVALTGSLDGDRLILDERFRYSDGTTQRRVWTLTETSPGSWRGTAADVVGEARGEVVGNTLHWRYVLSLPVDDKVYEVDMDDWMYLIDEDTLANRSFMSKFGVEVGQVTLFFRKRND